MEEECSADKSLYEAYQVYKEARDTLTQVRRGRGFWPVIATPAPDGRSATLAVRNNDEPFRGKGQDSKGTTDMGKSKGSKSGTSGKKTREGKARVVYESNVKGKGDTLKQRLVSRPRCRLCGEEGHWEEDCAQADVDMPQANRRVTFSRPPVVSQAWSVETWTVSPSTASAESRTQNVDVARNPREYESHGCHHDHACRTRDFGLWCCVGLEVAAARTGQAVTASGETRRPAVVDKIQRFKFGGGGDPVEASFAVTLLVQMGDAKTWFEAFVVPGSTPHLISRRWLS